MHDFGRGMLRLNECGSPHAAWLLVDLFLFKAKQIVDEATHTRTFRKTKDASRPLAKLVGVEGCALQSGAHDS